jgi:hypothetical protein
MDKDLTTIEGLTEIMREGAEAVQKHFDSPDDDWVPMMTLVPQEGKNVMLALDGDWFASEEAKDRLVEKIMIPAVNGVGAKMVATLFSAWSLILPEDVDLENLPVPSESDDRQEVVIMTVMDSFKVKCLYALVERTEDAPPILGEWKSFEQNSFAGRFVGDIQEALRDSSGQTDKEFMELLSEQTIQISE